MIANLEENDGVAVDKEDEKRQKDLKNAIMLMRKQTMVTRSMALK